MSILKIEPSAINAEADFSLGSLTVSGNVNIGAATIAETASGALAFTTTNGQFDITANTINFLSTVATTEIAPGDLVSAGYTGSAGTNGTIGVDGYTGSRGAIGFTGSAGAGFTGSAGAGFTGSAGAAGIQGAIGFTGSSAPGSTSGADSYAKTYTWEGALQENVSTRRFYMHVASTLESITVNLGSSGQTQSTIQIKKNNAVLNTIVIPADANYVLTNVNHQLAINDFLTVDITQSSSAANLYVTFVYRE